MRKKLCCILMLTMLLLNSSAMLIISEAVEAVQTSIETTDGEEKNITNKIFNVKESLSLFIFLSKQNNIFWSKRSSSLYNI